jgi:hypothetical protein
LKRIAELGGYFVESYSPSPLVGYPGALAVNFAAERGNWPTILGKVERAAVDAGGDGRMGTWAYPFDYVSSAALAEFGKRVVEGTARLDNIKDLIDCYAKYTPGAKWNAGYRTDARSEKIVLLYQDTYILGRGYMNTTDIEVPEKYIGIGR